MKNVFLSIKSFISNKGSETYILVSGGLTAIFIIFTFNAVLGIYSLYGTSSDLTENFSAIDMARSAQVALHEQVNAWEKILVSGGVYPGYRREYLEFSRKSEAVQNILFNLKLHNSSDQELAESIEKMRILHKKMTMDFTGHIVDMENTGFRNSRIKMELTKEIVNELPGSLSAIAAAIEVKGKSQSLNISMRYLIITGVSSLLFISLLIYYGRQTGRRLVKTHNILEEMVMERTREYVDANLSLKKEIEEHKVTAEKLVQSRDEVEEKNRLLTVSEKKYRHIVEGTRDIIFTLDEDWYFKTVNDAVKKELRLSPETAARYRLTDLMYDELTDAAIYRRVVTEKFIVSREVGTPLKLNVRLKTPNLIEPVEFMLYLEFVETEGSLETIGKAVKLSDDSFAGSFISERCEYVIKNLLFEADDVTLRITNNLQKYIDRNEVNLVRIGLREIIINSIEHGNLNITFDEKTGAIMEDRYFEFINERQSCPDYRDRRVRIEYMVSPERAVYKITDQGKGFNHRKYLAGIGSDSDGIGLTHGRGIAMVKSIFDEVKYNSKGNQVFLVKYLGPIKSGEINSGDTETESARYSEVG